MVDAPDTVTPPPQLGHRIAIAPPSDCMTWPSRLPVMAIDHVLVSPELSVSSLRVGPAIGSDHRPVLARVQHRR